MVVPRDDQLISKATAAATSEALPQQTTIKESEERFRLMADTAPVMLWMSGIDKLCYYFNAPWLEFTGRSLEQESGNGWAEGVHPDDFDQCLNTYCAAFDARQSFRMEYRLKRFDGQYRWILDTGTPRFNSDRTFAGYIGSCIDIQDQKLVEEGLEARVQERTSELKTLNQELAVARDQALEASALKSAFVANISHELRTPLSGIIGMNELLLGAGLNSEQRDLAQALGDSAHSLLRIVNDILDISKIEAGKLRLECTEFDPVSTIYQASQTLLSATSTKQLRFTQDIDPRIPRSVHGDPTRLRQILLNLIGNAIKFTDHGSVTVRAIIECSDYNSVVIRFSVTDTGIGLAPPEQRYLFTPFTQADGSSTRKYGGTGLGLAISKRLVELMGGTIGMTSSKGQGSVFWFVVPFAITNRDKGFARDLQASDEASSLRHKLVLVVEDSPLLQELVVKQLKLLGLHASLAATAREALNIFVGQKFDMILMDCQLPDRDGFETTRAIRQMEAGNRRTPIIAITANAMFGQQERCLQCGMDDYLSKPYTLEQLRQKLQKWLPIAQNDLEKVP